METENKKETLIRVHFRVNKEARTMLEMSDLTRRVKRELGMMTKPRAVEKRFEVTEQAYRQLKEAAFQSGLTVNDFLNLMFVRAGEDFASEVSSWR